MWISKKDLLKRTEYLERRCADLQAQITDNRQEAKNPKMVVGTELNGWFGYGFVSKPISTVVKMILNHLNLETKHTLEKVTLVEKKKIKKATPKKRRKKKNAK